jgi:hypothetical protein
MLKKSRKMLEIFRFFSNILSKLQLNKKQVSGVSFLDFNMVVVQKFSSLLTTHFLDFRSTEKSAVPKTFFEV